jgi:hypothetical protein
MFRYPVNQRLEITLRHLRGERAVDLAREFKIPERQIRRWKKIAVEAINKRLRGQLTFDGSPLHNARMAMRRLHDDVKDWKPDLSKLDRETWNYIGKIMSCEFPSASPKARASNPEAPPSSHNAVDEGNRTRRL